MQTGDGEAGAGFATARGRDWPSVRQFNIFVENRVGGLLGIVRHFETTDIKIISINIFDTSDCAIIRLVLNDPERATEVLRQADLMYTESDLLVVQLPDSDQPLLDICKTLLRAEINLHYAYPLLIGPSGSPALAIHVDSLEDAVRMLQAQNFTVYTEKDLCGGDE